MFSRQKSAVCTKTRKWRPKSKKKAKHLGSKPSAHYCTRSDTWKILCTRGHGVDDHWHIEGAERLHHFFQSIIHNLKEHFNNKNKACEQWFPFFSRFLLNLEVIDEILILNLPLLHKNQHFHEPCIAESKAKQRGLDRPANTISSLKSS